MFYNTRKKGMQKDFSYPLKIDELGSGEQHYTLNADKEELDILQNILQVPAVNSFTADFVLKFSKKSNQLKITGTVKANLGLVSVISLDAFDRDYTNTFDLLYDTAATYEDIYGNDDDINADVPDIIYNGEINLADIAIEQLALVMEDNPRRDGETFSGFIEDDSPVTSNPFAALSKLKK
jgi:uncharacterized metal-binding protein YceD (DUF177 family)